MVKNCDLGHSFSPYGPPSRQITYISLLEGEKLQDLIFLYSELICLTLASCANCSVQH